MTCLDSFDLQVQETRIQKPLPGFNLDIFLATSISAARRKKTGRRGDWEGVFHTSKMQEKEVQDLIWGSCPEMSNQCVFHMSFNLSMHYS